MTRIKTKNKKNQNKWQGSVFVLEFALRALSGNYLTNIFIFGYVLKTECCTHYVKYNAWIKQCTPVKKMFLGTTPSHFTSMRLTNYIASLLYDKGQLCSQTFCHDALVCMPPKHFSLSTCSTCTRMQSCWFTINICIFWNWFIISSGIVYYHFELCILLFQLFRKTRRLW